MLTFLFCRISIFLSGWARSKIYLQPFPIIKESAVWLKTSFCLMSMTLTTFFWFTHTHHRKETKEPGKEIHSVTETNFRCIIHMTETINEMQCMSVCVFRLSFQDNRYNKKKKSSYFALTNEHRKFVWSKTNALLDTVPAHERKRQLALTEGLFWRYVQVLMVSVFLQV